MTFGAYVKNARIERGLTLRAAAKASGIDVSDWSKMERDVNAAPQNLNRAIAIAQATGLRDQYCDATSIWWTLARDSWAKPAPVVADLDIEDSLPIFLPLTAKQKDAMRPIIRESLTRNPAF